MPYRIIR